MRNGSNLLTYARRVARDAAVARRRALARRAGFALFRKYLAVVPSVYSARGEFSAFRLLAPPGQALDALRERAVFTLDTATQILAGFRFGAVDAIFCYLPTAGDRDEVGRRGIGERRPGASFPLTWAPPGWQMLFTVVPPVLPPHQDIGGFRVVTREYLVRELIGLYGARVDLLVEIETKLQPQDPPPCRRSAATRK